VKRIGDAWSPRQQRTLSTISVNPDTIEFLPDKRNVVADALSRAPVAAVLPGIDYEQLAAEQLTDEECIATRTAITGLRLENIKFGENVILCDTSTGRPRPLVPLAISTEDFRSDLIGLAHPSVRASRKLVAERFVWHRLQKDVGNWARDCIPCQ
jgi:hypothetical protein